MFTNDNALASDEDEVRSEYNDAHSDDDLAASLLHSTSPSSLPISQREDDLNDNLAEGLNEDALASDNDSTEGSTPDTAGLDVPVALHCTSGSDIHSAEEHSEVAYGYSAGYHDKSQHTPFSDPGQHESCTSGNCANVATPHFLDSADMTCDEELCATNNNSSHGFNTAGFPVDKADVVDLMDEDVILAHDDVDNLHLAQQLPALPELVTDYPPVLSRSSPSSSSSTGPVEPSTPRFSGFTRFAVMAGDTASTTSVLAGSASTKRPLQAEEAAVRAYLSRYKLVIPSAF